MSLFRMRCESSSSCDGFQYNTLSRCQYCSYRSVIFSVQIPSSSLSLLLFSLFAFISLLPSWLYFYEVLWLEWPFLKRKRMKLRRKDQLILFMVTSKMNQLSHSSIIAWLNPHPPFLCSLYMLHRKTWFCCFLFGVICYLHRNCFLLLAFPKKSIFPACILIVIVFFWYAFFSQLAIYCGFISTPCKIYILYYTSLNTTYSCITHPSWILLFSLSLPQYLLFSSR